MDISERITSFGVNAAVALGALVFLGAMRDRIGDVSRRCQECEKDIAAYMHLATSFGVVGDSHYHREIATIYFKYGFSEDASREKEFAEKLEGDARHQ